MPISPEMLFNSAQGREFWLAIPPNEADGQPLGNTNDISIDIYVTSSYDTKVTVEIPGIGFILTKKVEAFKVTQFTTWGNETSFNWELRESEKISNMGIHVFADKPISVYVLNHRNVSSDGYLAIPTSAWGKDYIHLGYYDLFENLSGVGERRGSGFIITAAENQTKVTISLKGLGGSVGKTMGGQKIPKTFQINLDKGQVYVVRGDGTTRGVFDLSGSRIVANKPIGLISFHMRALIPSFDLLNGRNLLCEMIPPVQAWGKKYYTVELARKDHGDFFRVICAQPNTTFHIKWYDKVTSKLIGQQGPITLPNAGDFYEYLETFIPPNTVNTMSSIKGTSVFEADKPILVMQYSYSTDWDNAPEFDPFMILVVPVEQFIPGTVFQTPEQQSGFLTNWFNIIAVGDTLDPEQTKLKSVYLDGRQVCKIDGSFLYNRIPNTELYWAKLFVGPGAHRVISETKFGGYVYGFSSADGYGWPAAMAISNISEVDTLPPVLEKKGTCGSYLFTATEHRNGGLNDNPRQVDQGITSIELIEGSYNYKLTITYPDPFVTYPPQYDVAFTLDVIDKSQDAFALIEVTDLYGNFTTDSVSFEAVKLSLNPKEVNFGNVRVNTSRTIKATLTNDGDSLITIKGIRLQKGAQFKIINGAAPPIFDLDAKLSHEIEIQYTPDTESPVENIRDIDSLEIITECDTNTYYVHGRGVLPKIEVEDWDAGAVVVGTKVCKEIQTGNGLKISNPGTDTLIITNFKNVIAPFELSVPYTPPTPIRIAPKNNVWLKTPCYTPPDVNSHSIDVTLESNAGSGDSVSNWIGRGILPGPYVTPWDFGAIRINSLREAKVYVRNKGNAPVAVTEVKLRDGNVGYTIKPGSIIPTPSVSSPIDLYPEGSGVGSEQIELVVVYNPTSEGIKNDDVVALFDKDENIPDGSVFNWVKGSAYLPKIILVGYEFNPAIVSGTIHPTTGVVSIYSSSTSAPLHIDEIRWKNPSQVQFSWVTAPPSDLILGMGDSLKLPVKFHPTKVGKILEPVEVISDAGTFPDSIVTTSADVIGYAFVQGVTVTSIDYKNHVLCNQPIESIFVENTGSGDITIDSLVLQNGNISNFKILNGTFPFKLNSLASEEFRVQFLPDKVGYYSAEIKVYTDLPEDPIATLRGSTYDANLSLAMSKYDVAAKLAPGYKIKPEISMKLDLPTDAKVTTIKFDIVFNSSWMLYDKYIEKGSALDGTWSVTATETKIDNIKNKLTITCTGTNPVSATSGIIALPRFFLLLSDAKQFAPTIENITVDSRDVCVNRSSTPGLVTLNTCVIDLRGVVTTSLQYQLFDIEPNPVNGDEVNINFSIALDGFTRLELVNSLGKLEGVLVNNDLKAGKHELIVPVAQLNSGLYMFRLISGHYSETKQLVLTK
jgi:hypothetical protein